MYVVNIEQCDNKIKEFKVEKTNTMAVIYFYFV